MVKGGFDIEAVGSNREVGSSALVSRRPMLSDNYITSPIIIPDLAEPVLAAVNDSSFRGVLRTTTRDSQASSSCRDLHRALSW